MLGCKTVIAHTFELSTGYFYLINGIFNLYVEFDCGPIFHEFVICKVFLHCTEV